MSSTHPSSLRALLAAAEVAPFSRTGLGDAVHGSAIALRLAGVEALVLCPLGPEVRKRLERLKLEHKAVDFHFAGRPRPFNIWTSRDADGVKLAFIEAPEFYELEPDLFGPARGPEGLGSLRWLHFGTAVRAANDALGFRPQILHVHDHHAGLAAALWRAENLRDPDFSGIGIVATVHNPAYQGVVSVQDFIQSAVRQDLLSDWYLLHRGAANLLKAAVVFADKIATPWHGGPEALTKKDGAHGLEFVFEARSADLSAIPHGAPVERFDPSAPGVAFYPFSAADLAGKKAGKRRVAEELRLNDGPMVAVIGEWTEPAGFELFLRAWPALLRLPPPVFVVAGRGDRDTEDRLQRLSARHPGRIGLVPRADFETQRRVLAAADLAIFPGAVEHAGHMPTFSRRLGTLAITRARTADPLRRSRGGEDAFAFALPTVGALVDAVHRALKLYRRPDDWQRATVAAMTAEAAWEPAGRAYAELYREALEARRAPERDKDLLAHLAAPQAPPMLSPHRLVPEHYGRDLVRLMLRDPYTLLAYWEAEGAIARTAFEGLDETQRNAVRWELRMRNHESGSVWSLDICGPAKNHFVQVEPHRRYDAEVWVHRPNGFPVMIGRSAPSDTPPKAKG